jgi:hypothetical protein
MMTPSFVLLVPVIGGLLALLLAGLLALVLLRGLTLLGLKARKTRLEITRLEKDVAS